MPTKVTLHLHFPTHDKEVVVKEKLELDGAYVDDRADIKVPLRAGMNHHGYTVDLPKDLMDRLKAACAQADPTGEIIHLNAESGLQLKAGRDRFVGPDGRYNYASKIRNDAQELQAGRDPPKSDKFVVWMGIAIIVLTIGLILVALA